MSEGTPDQGVGGLDMMGRLADLFEKQDQRQQQMLDAHMNILTAMSQKMMMGGNFGAPTRQNTALAGQITQAALQTQVQQVQVANGHGAVALGNPLAGVTTVAGMNQQRQAQGAPLGGAPHPQQGNPTAGQTVSTGQGPLISGGGGSGAGGTGGGPVGGGSGQGAPGSSPGSPGSPGGGGGSGGGAPGYAPAVPAQSGGLADSMWGSAVRGVSKIPVVGGLAADVMQLPGKFASEWRDQRNKNLWYRAYGGDTSSGQEFADRVAEEKQRVRWMGTFDETEARQAFKQATAMGYTQNADNGRYSRQNIVDLMASNKQRTGMTVGESSQWMDMMGRNGDTGMNDLIDQLGQLEDHAGKAAVNVKQAQQSFAMMTQANYGVFGSAGRNVAFQDQQTQISWGKNFQDIDMSAPYRNPQFMYAMAGLNNTSMSQMMSTAATDKGAFDQMTGSITKDRVSGWLQSADPKAYQALISEINRSKSDLSGPAAGDRAQQIAEDWWNTQASRSVDPMAFVSLVNLWSGQKFQPMDRVGAMKYFIMNYFTSLGQAAQGQKAMDQAGQIDSSGNAVGGKDAGQHVGSSSAAAVASLGGSNLTSAEQTFKDQMGSQGGRYSGSMLKTLQYFQGHGGADDQMVRVETSSGYRVMKMSEAMKGGFESQITSGRAQMVGGTWAGKTIADLGIATDTSKKNTKAAIASEKRRSAAGQSYGAYHKAHPNAMTGSQGSGANKVTFDLTADAKKLLAPLARIEDAMGIPKRDVITPARDFLTHPSLKTAGGVAAAPFNMAKDAAGEIAGIPGDIGDEVSGAKDVVDSVWPWG